MSVLDDAGRKIDAEFHVHRNVDRYEVIIESLGPKRNTQYRFGMALILQRLASVQAILVDAVLASELPPIPYTYSLKG